MERFINYKPKEEAEILMFRDSTPIEAQAMRQWAHDNYSAGDTIRYDVWHPIVCKECELINNHDTEKVWVIYVFEDGETYSGEPATSVSLTGSELERIEAGEKVSDVVPDWKVP